ncbi:MAG: type II toxin-antitoxin system HicB family antitoxin [Chloroflexota bacterium]|nr:type II toxin-antitoxin system HicB family antitoxin [Chloroflexota bacterium]MDE2960170.1 type II toxin-antitoxin system HicB family antitoxin [Chloroflexota bacterium]
MERTYIALVEKDPGSDYGVWFTDLPGCITAGSTFEEACEMAREVLMLHLEGMSEGDEEIPLPSCANDVLAHPDAADAIALIVVEALPERTPEEAQAELEAFLASDEYQEIYGTPLTEEELDNLYEPLEEPSQSAISLKPVPDTSAGRTYAALVIQNPDDGFVVSFPDLAGCTASGSTLEETCEVARGALALHLEGLAVRGEFVIAPSPANAVWEHPDAADAVALIVVEALPERSEEAQAALTTFKSVAEYANSYSGNGAIAETV